VKQVPSIFALCLLVASASAETVVVVEEPLFCSSSQRPVISATVSGHSVGGARIDIYRRVENGERLAWTGSTDQQGVARPSDLEPGTYRVLAYSGKLSAEIRLGISDKINETANCEVKFVTPEEREKDRIRQEKDRLAALVRNAPSLQLKDFRGVVQDPAEAVIPRLKIQVLRKDALDQGPVAEVQSNERGQFALALAPGAYAAVFTYQGFATRAINFEIGSQGWRGLRIEMSVGGSPRSPDAPPQEWVPAQ
jgi:hypothetical protein